MDFKQTIIRYECYVIEYGLTCYWKITIKLIASYQYNNLKEWQFIYPCTLNLKLCIYFTKTKKTKKKEKTQKQKKEKKPKRKKEEPKRIHKYSVYFKRNGLKDRQ